MLIAPWWFTVRLISYFLLVIRLTYFLNQWGMVVWSARFLRIKAAAR